MSTRTLVVASKDDLLAEVSALQGITRNKNTVPVLAYLLVNADKKGLRITATDLDVSLRTSCSARVTGSEGVALSAKKLFEVVRSMPAGDVTITFLPDSWVEITAEAVAFKMAGLPADDFPQVPASKAGGVRIPASVLLGLIARTGFAMCGEDARYYLAGALLVLDQAGVTMVATDGHRLAYARHQTPLTLPEPLRVLVMRKAIQELEKLLAGATEVQLSVEPGERLFFTVAERVLSCKAIEGQFPAYERVIAEQDGFHSLTVDRAQLGTAIRRVSIMSSEKSRALRVTTAPGRLDLHASNPDVGEANETLACEGGHAVQIGFNAQYLVDFLGSIDTTSVRLDSRDAETQSVLRPAGPAGDIDHRYVVMPMRL